MGEINRDGSATVGKTVRIDSQQYTFQRKGRKGGEKSVGGNGTFQETTHGLSWTTVSAGKTKHEGLGTTSMGIPPLLR